MFNYVLITYLYNRVEYLKKKHIKCGTFGFELVRIPWLYSKNVTNIQRFQHVPTNFERSEQTPFSLRFFIGCSVFRITM